MAKTLVEPSSGSSPNLKNLAVKFVSSSWTLVRSRLDEADSTLQPHPEKVPGFLPHALTSSQNGMQLELPVLKNFFTPAGRCSIVTFVLDQQGEVTEDCN
ncbi:hypothetical protein E1B28_008264 [Marasmius oreades]|uniref:Uncharacterized protein n=1 Tax=Marasmius oreades TaxID=181124 RepID=A0A9P7URY0_9AGAR|nr:uncharacterized protein E1B28_008264 [Marasmius oreades]KAG7091863.1 hypothetical protein E1B28_008264 [Marasmius oreades]